MKEVNDCNASRSNIGETSETIVGSLDVKALYPSIDIEAATRVLVESFVKSEFEIKGINTAELGLYIAVNKNQKQIEQMGLAAFCPTRRHKRGTAPKTTGCAMSVQSKE